MEICKHTRVYRITLHTWPSVKEMNMILPKPTCRMLKQKFDQFKAIHKITAILGCNVYLHLWMKWTKSKFLTMPSAVNEHQKLIPLRNYNITLRLSQPYHPLKDKTFNDNETRKSSKFKGEYSVC